MPRREALLLSDLYENVREASTFLTGVEREAWDNDRVLQSAVLHKLMLMGEIARAMPQELRDRYPEVPWRRMQGFRNIAVHQYFAVDLAVVWKLATEDVPELATLTMNILRAEFPDVAAKYDGTAETHEKLPGHGTGETCN